LAFDLLFAGIDSDPVMGMPGVDPLRVARTHFDAKNKPQIQPKRWAGDEKL
jgi:hypothetical protein